MSLVRIDGQIFVCIPLLGIFFVVVFSLLLLRQTLPRTKLSQTSAPPVNAAGQPTAEELAVFNAMMAAPSITEYLDAFQQGVAWASVPRTGAAGTSMHDHDASSQNGQARGHSDASAVSSSRPFGNVIQSILESIPRRSMISETVLAHVAALCAREEQDPQTALVYSSDNDVGQLAYIIGSTIPSATVLALHQTSSGSAGHARQIGPMRFPGGLELRSVLAGGAWGEGIDTIQLSATPVVADVQLVIGLGSDAFLFEPHALRALIALSKWTLISFPMDAKRPSAELGSQLHRALILEESGLDDPVRQLDADVAALGVVRVPATQEMQALFVVRTAYVNRRVRGMFHEPSENLAAGQSGVGSYTLVFGAGQNSTMTETAGAQGAEVEVAGLLLETLLALSMPISERVFLLALALRDLQPGPASWVVCCGGIWQWCGRAACDFLHAGVVGIFSFLVCAFGVPFQAIELLRRNCATCDQCDQDPLLEGLVSSACEKCAVCILMLRLAQALTPPQESGAAEAANAHNQPATPSIAGFYGPLVDDVPGIGDLGNAQVADFSHCAHMCMENPRCLSFEFSPTATMHDKILNCQLNSNRVRAGVPFSDFVMYMKRGIPNSVDEGLTIQYDLSDGAPNAGDAFASSSASASSSQARGNLNDNYVVETEAAPNASARAQTQFPRLPSLFELDFEGLVDVGTAFDGRALRGWICTNISSHQASIPDAKVHKEHDFPISVQHALDSGGCSATNGQALVWQAAVPPGLYQVQVIVQTRGSNDLRSYQQYSNPEASCSVQGRQLLPTRTLGHDAGRPHAELNFLPKEKSRNDNSNGKPIDIATTTHTLWAERVLAGGGTGVDMLRLTGCHTHQTRLVSLRLQRTWRECPVPIGVADGKAVADAATVAKANSGPSGRYIQLLVDVDSNAD